MSATESIKRSRQQYGQLVDAAKKGTAFGGRLSYNDTENQFYWDNTQYGGGKEAVSYKDISSGGLLNFEKLSHKVQTSNETAKNAAEFRNKEYFNFRKTYLQSSGGSLLSDSRDKEKYNLVLG